MELDSPPWFTRPWPASRGRQTRGIALAYIVVAIGGVVLIILTSLLPLRFVWLLCALTFGYLGSTLWATVRWREKHT